MRRTSVQVFQKAVPQEIIDSTAIQSPGYFREIY